MNKICVLGDYESIFSFSAAGFDLYPAEDFASARSLLSKVIRADYGIIYITEQYLDEMSDILAEYTKNALPVITPLPSIKYSSGSGRKIIADLIKKAVGTDII